MRTGLITFHFAHHYGAQLQALATMRAIQSLGHDCEIIDYRLPHTTRTNQLFQKERRRARHGLRCPHRPPLRGVPAPLPALRGLCGRGDVPSPPSGTPPLSSSGPTRPLTTCMWRAATRSGTPISSRTSSLTPPSCWASSGRAAASPTPPAWACPSCLRTRRRSCAVFLLPSPPCPCGKSGGRFCCGRLPGGTPGWCWTPPSSSPARTGESWLRPQTAGALYPVLLCLRPRRGGPLRFGPVGAHRLAHRAARGGPAEDRRGGRAGL